MLLVQPKPPFQQLLKIFFSMKVLTFVSLLYIISAFAETYIYGERQ